MNTRYLDLAIGAPARLRILRAAAAVWDAKHPHARLRNPSWRAMRFGNLRSSDEGLAQGSNTDSRGRSVPIWYTFEGDALPREQFADEVRDVRIEHTGWFCDPDLNETCRGIIAKLPHGRFLAGYHLMDSGETVWFAGLHDSARDAALTADKHARVYAEAEHEYQTRWQAAQNLQAENDEHQMQVQRLFALRHHRTLGQDARDEMAGHIEALRAGRESMAREFSDIEL